MRARPAVAPTELLVHLEATGAMSTSGATPSSFDACLLVATRAAAFITDGLVDVRADAASRVYRADLLVPRIGVYADCNVRRRDRPVAVQPRHKDTVARRVLFLRESESRPGADKHHALALEVAVSPDFPVAVSGCAVLRPG